MKNATNITSIIKSTKTNKLEKNDVILSLNGPFLSSTMLSVLSQGT